MLKVVHDVQNILKYANSLAMFVPPNAMHGSKRSKEILGHRVQVKFACLPENDINNSPSVDTSWKDTQPSYVTSRTECLAPSSPGPKPGFWIPFRTGTYKGGLTYFFVPWKLQLVAQFLLNGQVGFYWLVWNHEKVISFHVISARWLNPPLEIKSKALASVDLADFLNPNGNPIQSGKR